MRGISQRRQAEQANRSRRGLRVHLLEFSPMDAIRTATDSRQPFRDAKGQGTIVFDPTRLQQADANLFDPASYGADAQEIRGQGGRGAAWYVSGRFGEGVLRHYRRGGLMARVGRRSYLWRGESAVRSFREFRLLQHLHRQGLPVPAPIAAMYRRQGLGYAAAIVVERIAGARSFLSAVISEPAGDAWVQAGSAIGRCHQRFAHHSDLNANNVLLSPDCQAWLIDWDKGRIEASGGSWREEVLQRLERSLLKEFGNSAAVDVKAGMGWLRDAHDRELAA